MGKNISLYSGSRLRLAAAVTDDTTYGVAHTADRGDDLRRLGRAITHAESVARDHDADAYHNAGHRRCARWEGGDEWQPDSTGCAAGPVQECDVGQHHAAHHGGKEYSRRPEGTIRSD